MAGKPVLLDRWGNPVQRAVLRQDVAAATVGGVRSPLTGYPADGLDPLRLAGILREADAGDPIRYLELAETIEERDLHYVGVLGTRRRAVSQLEITVEPGSDDAADVDRAEMVRTWLERDELADELFDILDCIGKGLSFTEIVWDTSAGQYRPDRLEFRDPRWFSVNRDNLTVPELIGQGGERLPLPAFKFICGQVKAKSGLPLRSGLARVAAWAWLFKAYTQRDWAIFTQTYGQPLRLGKFGPGASEADKDTLFRAVANIAGDCAAIIPESMAIEFVETGSAGATSDLYRERADWLDQQVSKAVLGQTATTDAIAGGHAVGREHRQVQEDIERADAKALSAILNRDLIRPWMQLEFGPLARYPRLKIARAEAQDLVALSNALGPLIDRGLKVGAAEVREKFGLAEPAADAEILRPVASGAPPAGVEGAGQGGIAPAARFETRFKGVGGLPGLTTAAQAEGPPAARKTASSPGDDLTDVLAAEARPAMAAMLGQIEAMVEAAGDMAELQQMLTEGFPDLDAAALVAVLGRAFAAAQAGGRIAVEEEAGG